ncbi:hypothetical protein [Saccharomonospora xinjiangensis]|uniref:Secreted protein n=1 Tax=Saccharomonospora xinjiangensis XJ-54 TaxID=882086 RepID=I0V384_9PSEU|nr:hypothetical protein [Saccharomonospora xinjiangensis]EID54587.1 hypothetical protein SacxiDRAFT_2358 [Saccharomonospora xinjiangensis XJ-54]
MTSTVPRHGPEVATPPAGSEPPGANRGSRSGLAGLLDLPAELVRGMARSAATTPGRLSLIGVGLVVLSLLTGLVGTLSMQDRDDSVDALVEHREPLAAAAQEVYRSLSDADATAATAFLTPGAESPALRERYATDIAKAGAALAKAASDSAGIPEAAEHVDVLSRQLPVYTGLVASAKANDRQGYPVGAAYLREASELLRSTILPAAEALYEVNAGRLAEEQDDATSFPWFLAVVLVCLIGALLYAQTFLKKKTNRVFNVGLLVSSGAVGLLVLWTAVALIIQGVFVGSGREDGTEQADRLVRARIAALQARADETLTLVARGGGAEYEQGFTDQFGRLAGIQGRGGLLGEAIAAETDDARLESLRRAHEHAAAWFDAHRRVRELDDSGEHQKAVELAIDAEDERSPAAAFGKADSELAASIHSARRGFVEDTSSGASALTLLAPAYALLSVVAALGATLGIRERLREYR